MQVPFEFSIPQNLTFPDFLAIVQTARTWADGYDLKSYPHLISTLAPQVSIDYTDVNPAWGKTVYDKEAFAKLWLSDEHLGNPALNTQHLLGLPYFSYVGPRRTASDQVQNQQTAAPQGDCSCLDDVQEIQVSWQILASHGRRAEALSSENERHPPIGETSDHRAFMTHIFLKIDAHVSGQEPKRLWKLALVKPSPIYVTGDFERTRRPADAP